MEGPVTRDGHGSSRRPLIGALGVVALAAAVVGSCVSTGGDTRPVRSLSERPGAGSPVPTVSAPARQPPAVRPAPAHLPVLGYGPPPPGFPADPSPLSTARLPEALRANTRVALYDAPGGRPRAFLPPRIRGVPLRVPIVARRPGWLAVLLPSTNRQIGWLPEPGPAGPARSAGPGGRPAARTEPWIIVRVRDQIIVERRAHILTWLRDGAPVRRWRVSLGAKATPTPLGRTFILGRSTLYGEVYAGTDVFALGAVPDNPRAVPLGLRGAHIGIHTWYHDGELGRNTTDGCIRLTRRGQRELLGAIRPGTPVVIVDRPPRAFLGDLGRLWPSAGPQTSKIGAGGFPRRLSAARRP